MVTPGFSGPEMRQKGSAIGPWTDIYAIGACIFSCMKGHPPPDANAQNASVRLRQYLHQLRAVYSDDLVDLVAACMTAIPARRPHSVYALQKMLTPYEFVNEDTTPAPAAPHPTNPWSERLKAFSKRLV